MDAGAPLKNERERQGGGSLLQRGHPYGVWAGGAGWPDGCGCNEVVGSGKASEGEGFIEYWALRIGHWSFSPEGNSRLPMADCRKDGPLTPALSPSEGERENRRRVCGEARCMESLYGLLTAHWGHEAIKITSRIKIRIRKGRFMGSGKALKWGSTPPRAVGAP